jgi:hypothetical protein
MHNARRWDQHVVPKRTSNVRDLMCQKSEELKEKNLQNSQVQRYIKFRPLCLFSHNQLQKIVRSIMEYVIVLNSVTAVLSLYHLFLSLYRAFFTMLRFFYQQMHILFNI